MTPALLLALALGTAPAAASGECVVLLHGLGRTYLAMLPLQLVLERAGYLVWNRSYPSTREPIERLARAVGEGVDGCRARGATRIHFVTHSMGGILVRAWFRDHAAADAGRVVMLAPPNHGSEIVDAHRARWWFRHATGPAGQQLGTASDSLPNRLPPLPLEVGVIAGTSSVDPWFGDLFAADHDGKVSVASAALPEMTDMVVVPGSHTFMMNSPAVMGQVLRFLRDGSFER